MRRKGEIGPGAIRRGFRFQVWFPAEYADDLHRGASFYPSAAPRPLAERRGKMNYVVICFADESDARAFMRHAGGELVGGS
ncbi:hypothetical protein [Xanthobacter autotrophicus]|uniref:hypothetical protein n=1 Tax=Xanthobacter autotrophicus TaxID=280 RepID=UPI0024A6F78A|nr:hypothetical protein [Xanthobacter autotrophicus]MDI4656012.1 hypothetical protein [Xanthobacter autotrophicus]